MGSIISSKAFCHKCIKSFRNKDVSVILSTGKVDPAELGTLPDNIYARSFVSQLDILKHADLFITHGGMNSVSEAMYFGTPMLVIPLLNDQPINAAQVERLKIGRKISFFPLSSNDLYVNAMELLYCEEIKSNALAISHNVHNDPGVRGAVLIVLQNRL